MKHDIFISHSSKDSKLAMTICDELEKKDIKAWIAPRDLIPGNPYGAEIVRGIENTSIVLLVFTENSYSSAPCRREIERACSHNKIIINLRFEDIPLDSEWQYLISSVHWLDAINLKLSLVLRELTSFVKTQLASDIDTSNTPALSKEVDVFLKQSNEETLNWLGEVTSKNNKRFLASNAHKYNPESYVERESFQAFFKENKTKPLMFVLGEAGMGKTNEMCNLIQQLSDKDETSCLAFNSQLLDEGFNRVLHAVYTDSRRLSLEHILEKINQEAKESGVRHYFFFDAINEASSYPVEEERFAAYPYVQLLKDVVNLLLDEKYSQFTLVVSCRNTPFEHLKNRIATELYMDMANVPIFSLERFSNNELIAVFDKYCVQYGIQTSREQFISLEFAKIRDSLSSPLLFKLVVQSYENKELPNHIEQYDFVVIVKNLLSKNLFESNFSAYELLLRLTQVFRKKHIDNLNIAKILGSNDKELISLKEAFIGADGKLSEVSSILFKDGYLKYSNGSIRFTYEKVQEALFEISFFNEYENQYERGIIPAKVYEEIILEQKLEYDIVSYSYLCNALVNNYLVTKDDECLKTTVLNSRHRIQVLGALLLSKLSAIGYESTAREMVKMMLYSSDSEILDSALKTISIFYHQYKTADEFKVVANTQKSPTNYFINLFNNSNNHEVLNKAGVFIYNIILQNSHLADQILNELYVGILKGNTINMNFMMQLGLLSFVVSIDKLVNEKEDIQQCKAAINDNVLLYWNKIFEKVFDSGCKVYHPDHEKASKYISLIPGFLRNTLLKMGIKLAMLKYFNIQSDYTNNLKEYENFWKNLPAKSSNGEWSKRAFSEITELFDSNIPLDQSKSKLIVEGIKTGDVLSFMMIERLLIIRGMHDWQPVREIIEKALSLNQADSDYVPYIQMSYCYVLFHIIDKSLVDEWRDDIEEVAFKLLEKTALQWSKTTYGRFKTPYIDNVKTSYGYYKQFVINWYIIAACKKAGGDKYGIDHMPMLKELIDELVSSKEKDRDLLFYIIENISLTATNLGKIYSALALYDYILSKVNTERLLDEFNLPKETEEYKDKKLDEYMISILNTIRSFFPNQTLRYEADKLILHKFQGNPLAAAILSKTKVITVTEETLGSLLTSRFGNFFVWGLNDQDVRSFFIKVLTCSENVKNGKDWAFKSIQYAFNDLLKVKI